MEDLKITINEVPSSANHPNDEIGVKENRRGDWKSLLKYKKRWEKKLLLYKIEHDLPDLTGEQVEIKFKFYHPISRKRDHDNYFIAMKGMIDGLFKEDDSQWVTCNFPDLLIDKDNPRTEIWIKIKKKKN